MTTTAHGASRRRSAERTSGAGWAREHARRDHVTIRRHAPNACMPVTFCSMIELASASKNRSVRPMRTPGLRRCAVGDEGVAARVEVARIVVRAAQRGQLSERPVGAGTPRRAPDDTAGDFAQSQRGDAIGRAAGPPDDVPATGIVGSPPPWRWYSTVRRRSSGCRGRYSVSSGRPGAAAARARRRREVWAGPPRSSCAHHTRRVPTSVDSERASKASTVRRCEALARGCS